MAATLKRINYCGDMNIEYGGFFYRLDNWDRHDYQDVIRVIPVSDVGGADNIFWIEHLVVNRRRGDRLEPILKFCDLDLTLEAYQNPETQACALIEAHVMYGEYDQYSSHSYQIGPDQDDHGEHVPVDDRNKLRDGTDLKKYVLRHFRNLF